MKVAAADKPGFARLYRSVGSVYIIIRSLPLLRRCISETLSPSLSLSLSFFLYTYIYIFLSDTLPRALNALTKAISKNYESFLRVYITVESLQTSQVMANVESTDIYHGQDDRSSG